MRRFITECLLFCASFVALTAVTIVGVVALERRVVRFDLPEDKTVVIVGDSHLECAIDDSQMSDVVNLAKTGTSYVYSYLKVKAIIDRNPQLSTVVLGYSPAELRPDRWIWSDLWLAPYLPSHLFLFDHQALLRGLRANPVGVVRNLCRTPPEGVVAIIAYLSSDHSLSRWGGHLPLNWTYTPKPGQRRATPEMGENPEYSQLQKEYLLKIYRMAQDNNIRLVLAYAPVLSVYAEGFSTEEMNHYRSFAQSEMPDALLVDHSGFVCPLDHFADPHHLNIKGAKNYSKFLARHGFVPLEDEHVRAP